MVELVFAREAAPVKKYVLEKAKKAILECKKSFIIVPSQMTLYMEREIINFSGTDGFMFTEVLSFERLAYRLLQKYGGIAVETIDATGISMMAKKALEEEELSIINFNDETIHEELASLVEELRREDISWQDVEQTADGMEQMFAKNKLKDVSRIYRNISAQLEGKKDSYSIIERAIENVQEAEYIKGADIILYGFDVYSEQKLRFIYALMKEALEFTACFTVSNESDSDAEIFRRERKNMRRIEEFAKNLGKKPEYINLNKYAENMPAKNIYAYPYEQCGDIEIIEAEDKRDEITLLAAKIIDSAKNGIKMREMCVIAAEPKMYENEIKDIFGKAGIPFFMDEKRSAAENPLAVLALSALDIMDKNWRVFDVLRHIKTGFLPIAQEDANMLCMCQKMLALKGYAFKNGFKGRAEYMEKIRETAFSPLIDACKNKNKIDAIKEYIETLGCEQKLENEADRLDENGLSAEALYLRQVYETILELLGQAEQIIPNASAKSLRTILAAGLSAKKIAVIPPETDEVLIGDVVRSTVIETKKLFIIGANDGVLPAISDGADLFSESETEIIKQKLDKFPSKIELQEQKYYIVRALGMAKDITVFYNNTVRPSMLVHRLCTVTGKAANTEASRFIDSKTAGIYYLAEKIRDMLDGGEAAPETLYAGYSENGDERLKLVTQAVDFKNTAYDLGRDTAAKLYENLSGSATMVERYYGCPYRHFIQYGLRPEEIKELDETNLDMGIYIHELLDRFTKIAVKGDIRQLSDDEIEAIICAEALKMKEEHNNGIFVMPEFEHIEKRLIKEAVFAAEVIREHFQGTKVQILKSEASFGFGKEALTIELEDGRQINLKGKIDRVDVVDVKGKEYVRIVDYKTGAHGFDLANMINGLQIQLVAYLKAIVKKLAIGGEELNAAGGFYFNVHMPVKEGRDEQLSEMRMRGFLIADADVAGSMDSKATGALKSMYIKINKNGEFDSQGKVFSSDELDALMSFSDVLIKNAAEDIYRGKINISPCLGNGNDECRWCDYRTICRFDKNYGNKPRRIQSIDKTTAMEKIKNEID